MKQKQTPHNIILAKTTSNYLPEKPVLRQTCFLFLKNGKQVTCSAEPEVDKKSFFFSDSPGSNAFTFFVILFVLWDTKIQGVQLLSVLFISTVSFKKC